jgi:peptidoglycan/LPS O-acetylase OafA/YrhL
MVNTLIAPRTRPVRPAAVVLVSVYVVIALATLPVLALLSAFAPEHAPTEAWVHAAIVAVLAGVLPLRLRWARRGDRSGWVAAVTISGVLAVANVVEASIPGLFPGWMRVEMVVIAAVMVALLAALVRGRSRAPHGR